MTCFVLNETDYLTQYSPVSLHISSALSHFGGNGCKCPFHLFVCVMFSPPDRAFGFGAGSSLTGAAITEEAMDTSTISQPMTVCRPGNSTGILPNFHMNR